jgi:hypothetical protein
VAVIRRKWWRTYAAWMEGALESDIKLIEAAMARDRSTIKRASNIRSEANSTVSAVAGFGTRLATRHEAPAAQVPENKKQKKWRGGWDSNPYPNHFHPPKCVSG